MHHKLSFPRAASNLLRWSAVVLVLGCTAHDPSSDTSPDRQAAKVPRRPGLRVSMSHHNDDGGSLEPVVGATVLVFRSDAPGMAELLEWGTRGTSERMPEGTPAVFATPPHAQALTNQEGVAHFDLAPGQYVVTTPDSALYESISILDGQMTACSHAAGFRFVRWDCEAPK